MWVHSHVACRLRWFRRVQLAELLFGESVKHGVDAQLGCFHVSGCPVQVAPWVSPFWADQVDRRTGRV